MNFRFVAPLSQSGLFPQPLPCHMRRCILLAAVSAAISSVPSTAQALGAPALPRDGGREVSLLLASAETGVGGGATGAALGYRRTGRVNLSASVAYLAGPARESYAEVGTFGRVASLPGGLDLGWTAGVGFGEAPHGLFVPVGLNLSRELRIGGVRAAPFAHGRMALVQIDPPEREGGHLAGAAEVGVDLSTAARWGIRAAGSLSTPGRVALGVVHRR